MTPAERFFQDMRECPHIMTYREMGKAMLNGAIAGEKAKIPGGALTGAVAGLCFEAGTKVVALTKDLLLTGETERPKIRSSNNKPR
jgi:hypothetical protein